MNEASFTPPEAAALLTSQIPPKLPTAKPGALLLTATILIVLANMFVAFLAALRTSGDPSYAIGAGVGQFVGTVIAALLFAIVPRFRNPRSVTKTVLWATAVLMFSNIGRFK